MTKCLGCGAILQDSDSKEEGYTRDLNNKFCQRCFEITHYNKYISINKSNKEYIKKIKYINKTNDLVILTIDLFNMLDLDSLEINNPVILAITKKDIIPRSIHEEKILKNIETKLNIVSKIFISSKKNYNLDELMNLINKYKVTKRVYVIGLTNAGKSSLINKIIKNYSSEEANITVSNLPSTTLDYIEKKVNEDLILIDTPGLLDDGNIMMKVDCKEIIPVKEINPIIYQIKCRQSILISDFFKLDVYDKNILIFYMSNKLKIERIYKENNKLDNLKKYNIKVLNNQDLAIKGLGFIKIKNKCNIDLFLPEGVNFFIRNSII